MSKSKAIKVAEIDERTRLLGFERAEGTWEYHPYIRLKKLVFQEAQHGPKDTDFLEFSFEGTVVSVKGRELAKLPPLVRRESVAKLSLGIDEDCGVEIRSIDFLNEYGENLLNVFLHKDMGIYCLGSVF